MRLVGFSMPLQSGERVRTFADAYRVVGWYECRWFIEEYHKGMKAGCQIESPQFTSEDRLQPAIALLSIVTLTLLAMRDASRREDAHTCRATSIISEDYVTVLSIWRHGQVNKGISYTVWIGWHSGPRRSRLLDVATRSN